MIVLLFILADAMNYELYRVNDFINLNSLYRNVRYARRYHVNYTDDLDLGYVPSVPTSKSRAGSMK